jgi:hypothetical protein
MLKPVANALLLAALAAAPAMALDDPEEAVRAIYDGRNVQDSAAHARAWLPRDVAASYLLALKADEPKPATDFDWRYGSQEFDVSQVHVAMGSADRQVGGVTVSDVRVTFRNFDGPPQQVTWTVCLGARGWRVADVSGTDDSGDWHLRQMLDLPADQIVC